ncbi:MAG TPA: acetyl-CoA carboxylase carboxyltransferase subunit alpha [Candidatus Aminicenantes bacterium]|nr:acetyl-CoA carboxylase carboxyltransferase subunit alpha [Candidatus Aminicenantes bacterium]HRY64220.1 acetyl-CoA carboxylase carboxyltransferase subunit alpha [Candidatus Aminicenantes bacterium]HRZ71133.1 acetyl-CoA carboxylase carboxyltransferase subunit alpha [Candidatus Aminicenantes bacterium]
MEKSAEFYTLEKGLVSIKEKIDALNETDDIAKKDKIAALRVEIEREWAEIVPRLSTINIVQIARHPKRPYTLDYIAFLFQDFMEMHGDRRFADDPAIVAGLAFYKGRTAAVIGHQKGRTTRARIDRNFGQANPEGYRKALRVMQEAEKFGFPVITFIDTPGAYPGIGAEERGQAEAIAYNLKVIARLKVPIINVVIGEGGSGGGLGIGYGDQLMMLEHSFYSVISPEGCAAIVWKDQNAVEEAAENLGLRAQTLLDLGIIDKIIPEPPGGAHIDPEQTFKNVDKHISQALKKLEAMPVEELLEARYAKIRRIGVFEER